MLKIKDSVDLKELEKFGFELNQWNEYRKEICGGRRGQCFDLIVFNGENRTLYGFAYGADGDGEEVPLIKYRDKILHWNKEKDRFEDKNSMNTLYEMDFSELNDEVEIIEEDKKIEEIETYDEDGNIFIDEQCFKYVPIDKHCLTANEQVFVDKINEIIDYLEEDK